MTQAVRSGFGYRDSSASNEVTIPARPEALTVKPAETAVIVEGYMDALQAHQAGFTNVVAGMGTALTEPQLKQLGRYAKRLILALDPDAAGVNATMRGLSVMRKALGDYRPVHDPHNALMRISHELNIDVRILTVPDGLDPDDLIRETPKRCIGHARHRRQKDAIRQHGRPDGQRLVEIPRHWGLSRGFSAHYLGASSCA